MDREQKATAVAELTEDLKGAEAIFAVDYRGISVTEAAELRGKLREADAVLKVVKNRLAKRATADAGTADLDELLVGPTALALIKGDAVIAAKAIADFAKVHEELEYKGGIMDGASLDPESFQVIARLPGVDVLHGQVVMMVASPLTGLVTGLSNMISGLGRQLAQVAEQGLVTGEPPAAEEPAAEEAPAEEPAEAAEEETPTEQDPAEEAPAAEESSEGDEAPSAEEAEPEAPAEEAEPETLAEEPETETPAEEPEAEETSDTETENEESSEESSADTESEDE
jgi:large subunit ribosomal protein L10